jgi:hypothetical protein
MEQDEQDDSEARTKSADGWTPTRTSTASAATAARAGATTATTIRTAARGATTARRRSSGQVRDDDGGASAEYSKPVTVKNVPRGELPRNADGERGQLLELRLHGRERSLERRHERRLPLRLLVHGRLARGCDLRLERNGLLCQLSFRRRADQADGADADHRHGRRLQRVHQRCYRRERRTDRDLLQQRGRLLVSATSASGDSAPLRRHEQAALDREGRALGPDRDDERSRARTDAAEGPVGRCCAPRCRPALRLSRRGLGTMGEAVALLPSTVRANRGATAEREWPIVADRHDFAVLDLSR